MKRSRKKNKICVSFRWKSITQHFSKIISKEIMTKNKQFQKTMKPFTKNKGCLENNDIIVDGEDMITNYMILTKRFKWTLYKRC